MANAFITPEQLLEVAEDSVLYLRDNLVAGNLCQRNAEGQFANKIGDRVKVSVAPDLGDADEFTSTTSATNLQETERTLIIEKHFYKRVDLTSKEKSLDIKNFQRQVVFPMVNSVAQGVENFLIAKWAGIYARNLTGTAGTNPTTLAHLLAGRRKIVDNRASARNLVALIPSATEEAYLQIEKFASVDYGPERPQGLREAVLGRLHGTEFFQSHAAADSFNRGDIAGTVLVAGAGQSGSTLNVDAFTAATGTVKAGTRLTAAGLTGTYTVIQDATITGNAASLVLDRAMVGTPTNDGGVTFQTAFTQALLYNWKSALAAVVAPAALSTPYSVVASFGGLSLRISMDGSTTSLSDTIVVDTFAAADSLRPEAGVVWQG